MDMTAGRFVRVFFETKNISTSKHKAMSAAIFFLCAKIIGLSVSEHRVLQFLKKGIKKSSQFPKIDMGNVIKSVRYHC